MMPMFSPDGKNLTFVDTAIGNGNGQGIATMTFDESSRTAAAYKKAYQVTDTSTYPGWPFYLPDGKGIAFAIGNQTDFSGGGLGLGLAGAVSNATSDLYVLDLASGTATLLAEAVGFASPSDAASNTTYLPFSATDELHHNFYPTVSPVAAGGYFWLFFDSYRHYGNQGLERQLWGTAITVSATGTYTADASHPAFYVTGQEAGTGNHRAFTALDPCKMNGNTCTQGEDCCGGFCTNGTCGTPPACSNVDDACSATQKCCDPTVQCIGGYCATLIK
jgi:Tol biopolymer transport system component